MTRIWRRLAGIGLALSLSRSAEAAPELAYQLTEGQNLNAFVRDGPVAAHLLLRNGQDPRILIAFPAGKRNSNARSPIVMAAISRPS